MLSWYYFVTVLHLDIETDEPSDELGSQIPSKNHYSSIQEDPEIELYNDELQTSKMRIMSEDTTEVMT